MSALSGTVAAGAPSIDQPSAPGPTSRLRGPRGARVGSVVVADGARWEVIDIDPTRREAICRLLVGSRVLHRFRARQISRVERGR